MSRKSKSSPVTQDKLSLLAERISECETVISHLIECPAFKIIKKDLTLQEDVVNNNWHLTKDEKQLNEFKITKFAVMHLKNIEQKYAQDLEEAKKQMEIYQNPETKILKDYDGG